VKQIEVKVDTSNLDKYIARFDRINLAVSKAAGDVEATAKQSILARSTQYIKYKRGKSRYHWSSEPGHPPNKDRGRLANSITHRRTGDSEYEVSAGAKYAIGLEIGTKRAAARPFMVPALDAVKPTLVAALKTILGD
jgi:HK97 gp10 family phage protein